MSHHPEAEALLDKLRRQASPSGYHLNPDLEFVLDLMDGLLTNLERYGYLACPCMEAEGERAEDLDIICPCDYRDADLVEHGTCFCALYVSQAIARGEGEARPIPLRRSEDPAARPHAKRRTAQDASTSGHPALLYRLSAPVHLCRVCGYLAARPTPPLVCPICHAEPDRFDTLASSRDLPIWRCTVCGYLAARETPPGECPVCWASSDRFELLV